jgi:hypothetical protein
MHTGWLKLLTGSKLNPGMYFLLEKLFTVEHDDKRTRKAEYKRIFFMGLFFTKCIQPFTCRETGPCIHYAVKWIKTHKYGLLKRRLIEKMAPFANKKPEFALFAEIPDGNGKNKEINRPLANGSG